MIFSKIKKYALGSSDKRSIIANLSWVMHERILRMVLGLIFSIVLARTLGPSDFGLYNYAIALISLILPLSAMGLSGMLGHQILIRPKKIGEILATSLFLRVICFVISAISLILIVKRFKPESDLLASGIAVLAFGYVFQSFEVFESYFQSLSQSKYSSLAKSISFAIATILAIFFAINGFDLFYIWVVKAFEYILFGLFVAIFFIKYAPLASKLEWRVRFSEAKFLLSKSWPLLLSSIGAVIYLKIDQVMLAEMVGTKEVGLYSVAAQLSEVWYFLPIAIATSVFPKLVKEKKNNPDKYKNSLQKMYIFMFNFGLVLAILTTVVAKPMIEILYGADYKESAEILVIHIWACVFIFMRSILSRWLIMEDLLIFSFVSHGLGALANVILNFILIPMDGARGAAIATLISYAVASYLFLFLNKKTRNTGIMMSKAIVSPIFFLKTFALKLTGNSK